MPARRPPHGAVAVGPHRGRHPHLGADPLHGAHLHRPVADDEADAADQAAADQAGVQELDRLGAGGGRRRGEGRAAGGRRVPARPRALPQARRHRPQGHPPARPARHRQDAAGQGRRQGVGRRVLLAVGGRVRRDVRRPRRGPHPAPVRRGARPPPGRHLHRRDRRRRRRARLRQQLRARADAQPAAGRDGRLQHDRRPRRDRGLEPARQARPGAAAPRPLRPPDLRLAARRRRPRRDPARPHARQAAARGRPRADRAPDRRPHRRRPRQPLQRGGDLRRPRALRADRAAPLRRRARARRGRHAVAPHAQRARAPRRRLPRGRPRAVRRAAARRQPRAQDLDRPARPRARLHAQPARRRTATSRRARSSSTT